MCAFNRAGLVALPRGSALRTLEALNSVRIEQSRTSGLPRISALKTLRGIEQCAQIWGWASGTAKGLCAEDS